MNTDDLIKALAQDPKPASPPLGQSLGFAALIGVTVAMLLFATVLQPRPDVLDAVGTGWFDFKIALMAGLTVSAFATVAALARPGRAAPFWIFVGLGLALAAGIAADLMMYGVDQADARMIGQNSMLCLVSIPVLALAPLGFAIWTLRDAAPTRPVLAGAVAGLMSAGIGAVLYGLHCPDDSPLFILVWYGAAIAAVTVAGGLLGRTILRW